jgi:hypothetical protein
MGAMPRGSWFIAVIAMLVPLGQGGPAAAADAGSGERPPVEPRVGSPTAVGSDPADAATVVPDGLVARTVITADEHTVAVAPGLEHTSFDTLDARGWLRGDVLTADLGSSVVPTYLSSPSLSRTKPVSRLVRRAGAVAGVNGDFFDIGNTGAPLGVGVDRTHGLLHAPAADWNRTIAFDAAGAAWIGRTFLEATLTMPDQVEPVTITNLNSPQVRAGGIGLYTPRWGEVSRSRVVDGSQRVRRLHVVGGVVTASSVHPGRGRIPKGTTVLIGRGAGAATLTRLKRGDQVGISYDLRSSRPLMRPVVAVGGQQVLIDDGRIVAGDDGLIAPRTAVGIDDDTNRLLVLTVDGRQEHSRGTSLRETAQMLLDLGADEALNLDGGGSTTMLARRAGERPRLVNQPSDGHERNVPNGLGFRAPGGSGRLTGLQVRSLPDLPDAHEEQVQVLAGLSVLVGAFGHDEMLSPVEATPVWTSSRPAVAKTRRNGARVALVRGQKAGTTQVVASAGGVHGTVPVRVRSRPVRVLPSVPRIELAGRGAAAFFTVQAANRGGYRVDVAPRDVTLRYDKRLLQVRTQGDGFLVTARRKHGKPVIKVDVATATGKLPVQIGRRPRTVSPMSSTAGWRATSSRSVPQVELAGAPGRDGRGIALGYDFTGDAAVRTAYLEAPQGTVLPGDADTLALWVRGDGRGARLRATVRDATGVLTTVDLAEQVGFTGWRRLEAELPAQLPRPLELVHAYVLETDADRGYTGRLVLDELGVAAAPDARVPAAPLWIDPVVAGAGTVDRGRWTFAVLGAGGIDADDPAGEAVEDVRRSLREMVADDPDFVVVLGDLVDSAFAGDLELARQVLDEELGDVPWHYVPGEREAGDDGLATWRDQLGDPVRRFDHRGTRFVLLDTSAGSLRLSGFDQLLQLQQTLTEAADDAAVRSVVVLGHHPLEPADGATGLSDPFEAELVQDWLARLRAGGTDVAYLSAHAGVFAADRHDGVQHLSAGSATASQPGRGGFAGWSSYAVARPGAQRRGAPWLRTEVRPYVDRLTIQAPASVRVGEEVRLSATVGQQGRSVPVAYPMSVRWTSTPGAHVDPRTGRLRALRPGTVTVGLEVSGTTVTREVEVRGRR